MNTAVFSLLVENTPGVTSHIAGLFSRRGYNIDSFSSGVTTDPKLTRITIQSTGDNEILEQIEKQLRKLEDVVSIKRLDPENSVTRELILVKIRVSGNCRQDILSVTNIFRANIIDVSSDSVTVAITGTQSKLRAFIGLLGDYEILEMVSTGLTGLSRGTDDLLLAEEE